jgi:phthiodiolone/phenolphthiodiolone dimycocerosates ketoreductase
MLAAFAELAPGMTFGVAVTDGIRLHPAIIAQNAVSLDHQSGGRFILGVGAGEKMNLTVYGFDNRYAVSRMKESIQVMKKLWTTSGQVNHSGRFFNLDQAVLEPKSLQQPHVPIWIAGNGPRTRKLTAELADGWFPAPALPEEYKEGLTEIYNHMKKLGRDPEEFSASFWGRIYMHEDPAQISQYLFQRRGQLLLQPHLLKRIGYWKDEYEQVYLEQGLDPSKLSLLTYDAGDVARIDTSKMLPIVADIPESIIKQIGLVGSPEEIAKRIDAFIKAGVRHFSFELLNGVSKRNAPFTYWDVSRILAEDIIAPLKD